MPELPPKLPNLWKTLDHFRELIGKVHESLSHPEQKRVLGELLGKLQESRAEAEKVVPEAVKSMHQKNVAMKAWAEEFQARMAEKQQELEKRKEEVKQKPARTVPETPSLGRHAPAVVAVAGQTLQEELLKQLGVTAARPTAAAPEREIWQDLSAMDHEIVNVAQAESAPPPGFRGTDHGLSLERIRKLVRDFLAELRARRDSGDWTNW